jgi:hypothetical protein
MRYLAARRCHGQPNDMLLADAVEGHAELVKIVDGQSDRQHEGERRRRSSQRGEDLKAATITSSGVKCAA